MMRFKILAIVTFLQMKSNFTLISIAVAAL